MTSKDLLTNLKKPELLKLKSIGFAQEIELVMGDRVVIAPVEAYTDMDRVEQEGKLVIPESVREKNQPKPTTGVIVKIGPDVKFMQAGMMVVFPMYHGHTIRIDNVEYIVMHEAEIMLVLKPVGEENLVEYVVEGA